MVKEKDNSNLAAVVLGAGKGKRMKSELPKVLHPVCGRPIVAYVLDQVDCLAAGKILLVVGHGSERVREELGPEVEYVEQADQKGTGHAVMVALDEIEAGFGEILVLPGDSPLIRGATLEALVDMRRSEGAAVSLVTAELEDPGEYGRVLRDSSGAVKRIVEEADASDAERAIEEVNACTYAFDRQWLEEALGSLTTENAQGEYYLTSIVELAISRGLKVVTVPAEGEEISGVNDRGQLAAVGAVIRRRINRRVMDAGATIIDPEQTYIDHGVEVGMDTVILPQVHITGGSRIGRECRIGPCTRIHDSQIGDGTQIEFSWLDGSEVGKGVRIGPFSRIRPGCRLRDGVKAGSFVDLKNAVVGRGSKVPHLSYIGDAVIGEDVNVGAGSITCNYDGEKKHRTDIEDGAFIGSDTMLIAPVKIGKDAVTGAGSSIYEDVPDGCLGIERNKQQNIPDYHKKKKGRRAKGGSGD